MADEDPRIPQVHTCYKCLLQGKEPDVYIKLENLTLLMKAVHIVFKMATTTIGNSQKLYNVAYKRRTS